MYFVQKKFRSDTTIMENSIESITALAESAKFTLNQRAFTLREGETYRNFTEQVFWSVGELLRMNFKGADVEAKARIKTPQSIKKKVQKQAVNFVKQQLQSEKLLDINDFTLYDVYGAKVVVLNISDDFYSSEISIDGFLEKRKKCRQKLIQAQEEANKFPADDKLQEIARLNHVIYSELDTMCQRYVAASMCRFIMNSKDLKTKFGIFTIPERFRNYNMSNEYIAQHITLGSTLLPGWFCEFQFKSCIDYEIARTGPAAHFFRSGKQIVIPNSLDDISEDEVPSYMVYTPEGLYIPSITECKFHYLLPAFTQANPQNKQAPEKLLKLLSEFPENDNGFLKKF